MQFRFKDAEGKVVSLSNVAALLGAIQNGAIAPDTPFALGDERAWRRAESVAAYREAAAALHRIPPGFLTPGASPGDLAASAQAVRVASRSPLTPAACLGIVLVLVLASIGIRSVLQADRHELAASTAVQVQEELNRFGQVFGDSIAQAQRKHRDWLSAQRLDRRFSGASLKSPASLRVAVYTAHRLRINLDSLLTRSDALIRGMIARADSMEAEDPALDGLAMSLEDLLDVWSHDLDGYAALERGAADVIQALATFLLAHQQSFTIEAGRPRFLSHADAVQYRELWGRLDVLAKRELVWARAVQRKWPYWKSNLTEASQPRFGEPFVAFP